MPQQTINNGETGLVVRTKLNDMFGEIYDVSTFPYPQVLNFASLPSAAANSGAIYIVQTTTGIIGFRNLAGLYRSDGASWIYLGLYGRNAVEIVNVPAGTIAATDVQAAINELDGDLEAHKAAGGAQHPGASGGSAGFMSSADKTKLDAITGTNTGDQTSIVGITGSLAQFNTALTGADFATGGGTATGTNTGDQSSIVGISGTIAQFNTALSDGDFATGGGTATGTNTGDQTTITGNAGTATALQNSRNFSISGSGITAAAVGFNGTAVVTLAASVDAGHITLARMANLAANSIIGNNTGAGATPLALTPAQVRTLINVADGATANVGTVTSVDGTGTVSGITLTGTVNSAGNLTLGGTLSTTSAAISDFNSASRAQTEASLIAGSNITITPAGSGATRTFTIDAAGGGGAAWGGITGTLSAQTDLQSALDAKQASDAQLTNLASLSYASNSLKVIRVNAGETGFELVTLAGGGNVTGPGSSTDNAIARYDGAGGVLLQNSAATVSDDGIVRSATNSGANPVTVPLVNWMMLIADFTLNNVATEQKLFNTTTNGALTLPTGVYEFEAFLYLTTMSATSGNLAFDPVGAGTAVTDRWGYQAFGVDNTTPLAVAARGGSASVTQQSAVSIVTAATGTGAVVTIRGMFRVSTAGTIIPSGTLVTANAAVMKAGSYFKVAKIGESSETSVGAWT